MIVLVTGSAGFVGRNLVERLKCVKDISIREYDLGSSQEDLLADLRDADVIFHLAGVNRPQSVEEFQTGNTGFTGEILAELESLGRTPKIVFSSSIQAELDNPYGVSKRLAEEDLVRFSEKTGSQVVIYRLKNVFGKWCRPNYNSVTATFCHNIAHDLPITISDPSKEVDLVYIDDIVDAFVSELGTDGSHAVRRGEVSPSFKTTLGELAATVRSFRSSRTDLVLPDLDDGFVRRLYATYLSYLDGNDFAYGLDIKSDSRGSLAEFLKSPHFGQIFVSRTKPGITRGNHFHHTKNEKFLVVEGDAIIRFRHIQTGELVEYPIVGTEYRVVDIPPGYTHSIENVGQTELIVLFWASEMFNPEAPDTYFREVL